MSKKLTKPRAELGMSAEPSTTIEPDEQDEVEIAPGLLRRDLGEGRSELLSMAYGIPLDEPPRPEHAKALELYSASACDRLASLIEPDPGFRTPEHRRDFWIMMQVWARYVLDRLAAAEDREQARRNERKLAARLTRLHRDADRLHEAVTRDREVIAVFKRNAVATRVLAQELRTFSAAMERIRKRRRRGRPAAPSTLTEALELLVAFYQEATGKRPTIVTRERAGGRGYGSVGPSLAFAEAAMAPLFPDAGSLVDDWRKVSKKMQAESPE
jgi:hypothetical protein